ncbi:hypothetical protein TNCV_3654081 [Trichonephila clavipes]|nr:hypothetical protein TNCV_3654081 [Trichonephila clavipes]
MENVRTPLPPESQVSPSIFYKLDKYVFNVSRGLAPRVLPPVTGRNAFGSTVMFSIYLPVLLRRIVWRSESYIYVAQSYDEDDTSAGTPAPNFHTTSMGGCLSLDKFNVQLSYLHGEFSVASGLEPATLQRRVRGHHHQATEAT